MNYTPIKLLTLGFFFSLMNVAPGESMTYPRYLYFHSGSKLPDELFKMIGARIDSFRNLVAARSNQIRLIGEQLAFADLHQKKILQAQVQLNQKHKTLYEDKLSCYELILTLYRQIHFASNLEKKDMILQLESLLKKVDESTLDYRELKKKYDATLFARSAERFIPKEDCVLEKSSDGSVIANRFTTLFRYTPSDLEKHLGEDDFVTGEIRFLKSSNKYFCETRMIFNSALAAQYYGIIEASNPMKLVFMDGEYIYLQNSITALPDAVSEKGKTIYKMQCPISHSDLTKLKKKDLDQLTIVWPSGPETYDLFHLHTIQNLLKCLLKKN